MVNRIGRKSVFTWSLIGLNLGALWSAVVMKFWTVIPVRMLWLAPVFTLFGGGLTVANMMFYAIACDITPQIRR